MRQACAWLALAWLAWTWQAWTWLEMAWLGGERWRFGVGEGEEGMDMRGLFVGVGWLGRARAESAQNAVRV